MNRIKKPAGKALFFVSLIFLLAATVAFSADETEISPDLPNDSEIVKSCEDEISELTAHYSDSAPKAPRCARGNYDAIIILGSSSNEDCTPSASQHTRVDIAMRFFEAGYAENFIPSGGSVYNGCVEANVIEGELVRRGIAEENIFPEPLASTLTRTYISHQKLCWKTAGTQH